MTKENVSNLAASVHQRLLNHARRAADDPSLVLMRYGLERLLYRLSESPYADQFVVKGAMMFLVWAKEPYRSTKDLDLMAHKSLTVAELQTVFRALCGVRVADDGLVFLPDTVRVAEIREDTEYGGLRVKLEARLGKAKMPVQVDIGFGDAVTPKAEAADFPVLLDFPAPRLAVYPRETAVAEKFETLARRGMLNSRMRDYYDLWVLSRKFEFDGETLRAAIQATFRHRKTLVPPEIPVGLSGEFAADAMKQAQWRAFIGKTKLKLKEADFGIVVSLVRDFLMPVAGAASRSEPFHWTWPARGPWRMKKDRKKA